MKQIALSIEQMKHLKELGVDCSNASMEWVDTINVQSILKDKKKHERVLMISIGRDNSIPALTLQDMLEILPKSIMFPCYDDTYTCILTIKSDSYLDEVFDEEIYYINHFYKDESPRFNISILGWVDAVYGLIVWCAEKGYLKQK